MTSSTPAKPHAVPVKVDRDALSLARRLKSGDIAIIDQADLDRDTAAALAAKHPVAVVNAQQFLSGRFPHQGPRVLLDAGIELLEDCGADILALTDGNKVTLDGNQIMRGEEVLAEGEAVTTETLTAALAAANEHLAVNVEAFTAHTFSYLRRETDLLISGVGVPEIKTNLKDRQVLIVRAGHDAKAMLQKLRPYIREEHPVLIGVGQGADVLLAAGLTPAIIVGDMSVISGKAIGSKAELVVQEFQDGNAPGKDVPDSLGLSFVTFKADGTAFDLALLLAHNQGAKLVVAFGTPQGIVEALDQQQQDANILTRMTLGGTLVDAHAVSELYRHRISGWSVALLVFAGLLALGVALAVTPAGQSLFMLVGDWFAGLGTWFSSLFR